MKLASKRNCLVLGAIFSASSALSGCAGFIVTAENCDDMKKLFQKNALLFNGIVIAGGVAFGLAANAPDSDSDALAAFPLIGGLAVGLPTIDGVATMNCDEVRAASAKLAGQKTTFNYGRDTPQNLPLLNGM